MNRTTEILQTLIPVLLMLVIGMICRRKKMITRKGINALKSVVVNISLPAVLFHAFASTKYSSTDILIPLIMFGICILAWVLGKTVSRALRFPSRFVPFLTTGFEAGMLGYALFEMLCGSSRVAEFARIDLGQVLFVFTVYKILLQSEERKSSGKDLLKEMFTSPIILAIIAGLLIGAAGLYQAWIPSGFSSVLDSCTDFISAPTSAIILLTVGYDLILVDVPWKATLLTVALRFGIMMLLRFVFESVLHLIFPSLQLTTAIAIMFLLPPPFVLPVFADDAGQRTYVSSVLSVYTLVSIAGFAVMTVFSTL